MIVIFLRWFCVNVYYKRKKWKKKIYDFWSEWKDLSVMSNFTENFSWQKVNIFIMWFLSLSSEPLKNIHQRKKVLGRSRMHLPEGVRYKKGTHEKICNVFNICLYVLIMWHTCFRVNAYSLVAWMSRNSLVEGSAKSEV